MSVLACDRNGCKNIMCDRYSDTWGYICNECFDELVQKGSICSEVRASDVQHFMTTPKEDGMIERSDYEYFKEIFLVRD